MSRTPSTMVALGTIAPPFALPDVRTGKTVRFEDFSARRALLVMFICRHCPYVAHVQAELARLGRDYEGKEVGVVAISSNDAAAYADDAPASLAEQARAQDFRFPYLYDESQAVARAYDAACTPDFFLYQRGAQGFRLVYRGQLDDSRPSNGKPVTGSDLRRALESALSGQPVPEAQVPSLGCNIKWR
ncbi:MAG: thioredoxin family protein [Myxococcaceae bacterium]